MLLSLTLTLLPCLFSAETETRSTAPARIAAADYVHMYSAGKLVDPELVGAWSLPGYGFLMLFEEDGLHVYSECSAGTWDITDTDFFTAEEILVAGNDVGDRRRITFDPLGSPYTIERLEKLPDACSAEIEWTPTRLFDVFAAVLDDYYPFFEVRGIDWGARVAEARGTVHDGMTEAELFDAMRSTLENLGDGHVSLGAEIDGELFAVSTETVVAERRVAQGLPKDLGPDERARAIRLQMNAVRRAAAQGIERELLQDKGQVNRDQFFWGRVQDDVGYIRINGMGFDDEMPVEEQVAEVHVALDEMLTGLEGVRAILLDCSLNGGGLDAFSHGIAEHFIAKTRQPYSKAPASRPDLQHTVTLEPWGGQRFTGPVFLVSSDFTASAAEIFQLCLKEEPHVTLVGSRGATIFSDVIPKTLPNGWDLGMSIEAYRDGAGVCYEGIGVPLDVEIPMFLGEDLMTSHTRAMERVLDLVWESF